MAKAKPYSALLVNEEKQNSVRIHNSNLNNLFRHVFAWMEEGYVVDKIELEYADGEKDEIWEI